MLRASSQDANLNAINDGANPDGVEHGDVLLRFAEAMVTGSDAELENARRALLDAMGVAALVDAAGVASNFQRMVRIADATGITLGDMLEARSSDVRAELDLERFVRAKT